MIENVEMCEVTRSYCFFMLVMFVLMSQVVMFPCGGEAVREGYYCLRMLYRG